MRSAAEGALLLHNRCAQPPTFITSPFSDCCADQARVAATSSMKPQAGYHMPPGMPTPLGARFHLHSQKRVRPPSRNAGAPGRVLSRTPSVANALDDQTNRLVRAATGMTNEKTHACDLCRLGSLPSRMPAHPSRSTTRDRPNAMRNDPAAIPNTAPIPSWPKKWAPII